MDVMNVYAHVQFILKSSQTPIFNIFQRKNNNCKVSKYQSDTEISFFKILGNYKIITWSLSLSILVLLKRIPHLYHRHPFKGDLGFPQYYILKGVFLKTWPEKKVEYFQTPKQINPLSDLTGAICLHLLLFPLLSSLSPTLLPLSAISLPLSSAQMWFCLKSTALIKLSQVLQKTQ